MSKSTLAACPIKRLALVKSDLLKLDQSEDLCTKRLGKRFNRRSFLLLMLLPFGMMLLEGVLVIDSKEV